MTKRFLGVLLTIVIMFTLVGFSYATNINATGSTSHCEPAPESETQPINGIIYYNVEDFETSEREDYYYGKTILANSKNFDVEAQEMTSLNLEESENSEIGYRPYYSALLIGEELADNIRDMTEEQVLAKFLDHEGGDLFEKVLIAEIVCDLKKEWNVESIHEVFTSRRYFAINRDFWNSIETPSESSKEIAHMVLECAAGREQFLSDYNAYYYNDHAVDSLLDALIGEREFFTTTNYIFVRR